MTTIDISPEAVEQLANRLHHQWYRQDAQLVLALSAALTESQDLVDRWINTSSEQDQTIYELREALTQLQAECTNLAAWQCVYTDGKTGIVCDEYGNQFCQKSRNLERSRAVTVKPLVWVRLSESFMAEDTIFNTVAITDDPAKYDAERAARILAAIDVQPDPRDEVIMALVEAVSALGLRKLVAGWNGEDRENPHPPHPPRLGVTLKTNAGAVYAIDAALAALETP